MQSMAVIILLDNGTNASTAFNSVQQWHFDVESVCLSAVEMFFDHSVGLGRLGYEWYVQWRHVDGYGAGIF